LILRGLSNDTPASVGGIVGFSVSSGTTYNTVNLSVRGSAAGGNATYTVYYYGLN
jgi:hypothetical protein